MASGARGWWISTMAQNVRRWKSIFTRTVADAPRHSTTNRAMPGAWCIKICMYIILLLLYKFFWLPRETTAQCTARDGSQYFGYASRSKATYIPKNHARAEQDTQAEYIPFFLLINSMAKSMHLVCVNRNDDALLAPMSVESGRILNFNFASTVSRFAAAE